MLPIIPFMGTLCDGNVCLTVVVVACMCAGKITTFNWNVCRLLVHGEASCCRNSCSACAFPIPLEKIRFPGISNFNQTTRTNQASRNSTNHLFHIREFETGRAENQSRRVIRSWKDSSSTYME